MVSDPAVARLLRRGLVDDAYGEWCKRAERILCSIPTTTGAQDYGRGRGAVAFRRLCVYPPERHAGAETVWMRKVAKALRRAEELGKMKVWGYRAEITMGHLRSFAREVRGPFADEFVPVVMRTLSCEVVTEMCGLLSAEYRRLQTMGDRARLRAWKDRMQSSIRQSHRWVRDECKRSSMLMRTEEGHFTVDRNEQLDHMLNAWKPIFEKFKSRPADCERFMEQFGPYMRSAQMELEPLTGRFLAEVARDTASSAPSLDMWRPGSLAALGHWAPGIFDDLALILDFVETTGQWPRMMLRAYTALIPKDSTLADPLPTEFRPITVLSGIYRLWSKARFVNAMKWQEGWVTDSVFGCRRRRSSEQLAMQIALDLEASAYGGSPCVGGVSYDFKKAFDLVPVNIMLATMRRKRSFGTYDCDHLLRCTRGFGRFFGFEVPWGIGGARTAVSYRAMRSP